MNFKTLEKLKVISWNVNSILKRYNLVCSLLEREKPDILMLQETKVSDLKMPLFHDYFSYYSCEGHRNGVAIISKKPLNLIFKTDRLIELKQDDWTFVCVYVFNGGSISAPVHKKISMLNSLIKDYGSKEKLVLGGDFNICYGELSNTTGMKIYSEEEINTLKNLESCFLSFYFGISWWHYGYNFSGNRGLALDRFFLSKDLSNYNPVPNILRSYRALPESSDHAPVEISLSLN